MVEEDRRAWHAGKSAWAVETDINSRSIGIEIANPGHEFGYRLFPDAQIDAVIALCRDILARHAIPARRVLAHSDVAPDRKQDPGELFPWKQLAGEGIGVWVEPEPLYDGPELRHGDAGAKVARLRADLAAYGYGIEPGAEYDEACVAVVRAFQRHFRPLRFDGVADASTIDTLSRLLSVAD
jgi:N-acetylmuramoyl-L-alanine amidase